MVVILGDTYVDEEVVNSPAEHKPSHDLQGVHI